MIENRFSDIFFFDVDFLNRLENKQEVSGNDLEGMFVEWLAKGKIAYDPERILLRLKNKISEKQPLQKVADFEKRDAWVKINYNFIANSRYYNSQDALYHEALELRLLYSVIELVTAYFSFRDIPWRGEKAAIKYLEQHDQEFLITFKKYTGSGTLSEKMKRYENLFDKVFFGEYQKWDKDFVVPISSENKYEQKFVDFWNTITGGLHND